VGGIADGKSSLVNGDYAASLSITASISPPCLFRIKSDAFWAVITAIAL
jgi:hypothetical protein